MFGDRSGVFHDRSGVFDDRSGVFQFYTDAKLPLLWLDLKDIKKIKVQNKHIYGCGNRLGFKLIISYVANLLNFLATQLKIWKSIDKNITNTEPCNTVRFLYIILKYIF